MRAGIILGLVGLVAASGAARADSFVSIDVPGFAGSTFAEGINNGGTLAGYYQDGATYHGFVDVGGTFTSFDVPGVAGFTLAQGINNSGSVVGYFSDDTGLHGFVKTGAAFTTLNATGDDQGSGNHYTVATGINDAGDVTGYFKDNAGNYHGFVDVAGIYTPVDVPGATGGTFAQGINAAGTVVGYSIASGGISSFIDIGGVFSSFGRARRQRRRVAVRRQC